jgi:uncharacterized protein DUF6875
MPAQSTDLFLLDDLEDSNSTRDLAESDLKAVRKVATWIKTFVIKPNKELGRAGPVCPFVPMALEHKTLWLAPEHIAARRKSDVLQLVKDYKSLFLHRQPVDGDDAIYKALCIVFTDLTPDRAKGFFDHVLQNLAVPSYADEGLVLGAFYESNQLASIRNPSFRPFTPPVPFLLMRRAVISDWKFFLDNDDWLKIWARRFGESAVQALAEELRRLPWRKTA